MRGADPAGRLLSVMLVAHKLRSTTRNLTLHFIIR